MQLQSKTGSKEVRQLFEAILCLENEEECDRFFDDLCTVTELSALAQRLEVARLLRQNMTYQDIASQLGASTATISRVNRCLSYGAGGYPLLLDRMEKKHKE